MAFPRNHIDGMILSNNTSDSDHDIDFTIGECRDLTDTRDLSTDSVFTKRLDATFADGTGSGMLDSGSISASTTYAIYAILSDELITDFLASTSFVLPAMPAGYGHKRLIGFINTDSSANILSFVQSGDIFWHTDSTVITVVTDSTIADLVFETATVQCAPLCRAFVNLKGENPTQTQNASTLYLRTKDDLGVLTPRATIRISYSQDFNSVSNVTKMLVNSDSQLEYAMREQSGTSTATIVFRGCNMLTRSQPQ